MKRIPVLVVSLFFILLKPSAQTVYDRVSINGGHELWPNFVKHMFLYPTFREATIDLRDGKQFKRPVNYNRMLETIQFISEKGDTLAIADEASIKQITTNEHVFVYEPACYQSVAVNEKVKFFKHEKLKIADIRRRGALGIPNSSGSIESINQVFTWMSSWNLDVNEILLLSKMTTFHIAGENMKMVPATRKTLLASLPAHEAELKKFIDSKKINFTKEAELVELANYISSL